MNHTDHHSQLPRFALRALSFCILLGCGSTLFALPTAGVVTAGNASIKTGGSNSLTVTQTSPSAVLNWQSFNVGAGESVTFVQPDHNAVALNRVIGSDPSRILGNLTANGKVFLVNPNGVLFGKDASVNVGGLVASGLDISDADFVAGRYRFDGPGKGDVSNLGTIHAEDGGFVALLGNRVSNEGTISAKLGTAVMAAGAAVTLDVGGDGLLHAVVDKAAVNALASNGGLIQADGGAVFMSAAAKDALLSTVVNNTGIVQANTVGYRNGRIVLDGGDSGVVQVGGQLQAAGPTGTQTGGTIIATGDKVLIADQAHLDASGKAGGGSIFVGGGWQGNDPAIRQATGVYISPSATLDASATQNGNGGTVVAWSNVSNPQSTTRVYGTLLARGGVDGGNGGRIETSGHSMDVTGIRVNASAPSGKAGQWLLDPGDLNVGAVPTTASFFPGPFATFTSGPGTSVLNTDIEAQLNAGTSVALLGDNISVNTNIAKTAGGGTVLIFTAPGNIVLSPGSAITSSSGPMDVVFDSGGSIVLGSGSNITSNGGNIVLSSTNFINNAGPGVLNTSGGGARWIVYSNNPSTNSFDGLNSGNQAIWGQNPGSLAPGAVPSGNRYVFATPGVITATTTSPAPKPYGQSISVAGNVTYSGAPLTSAASYGNVYQDLLLSDVLSTLPTVTSAGSAATASVAGSPYPVVAAGGVANAGYSISYANSGVLVINQALLTIAAKPDSRTYNGQAYSGGNGVTYSGFLDGDDASVLGGTLFYTGSSQGALNAGQYFIIPSGLTSNNYSLRYVGAPLTINPKPVVVTGLLAENKEFDGNSVATMRNWGFVTTGVGNETLVLNHGGANFSDASVGTGKTVTVDGYSLANGSNGGLASNYSLASTQATTTADIVVAGRAQTVNTVQAALAGANGPSGLDRWRDNFDHNASPIEVPTVNAVDGATGTQGSTAGGQAPGGGVGSTASGQLATAGQNAGAANNANQVGLLSRQPDGQSGTLQGTSRLSSVGLSSRPTARTSTPPAGRPAVPERVFLKGATVASAVGVTTSNAVVVAAVTSSGKVHRLSLAVAPGEGFELTIPRGLLGNVAGQGKILAQSSSGGPLPPWIRFIPDRLSLTATNVPAPGLPITVRLIGSSGRLVEVTFK